MITKCSRTPTEALGTNIDHLGQRAGLHCDVGLERRPQRLLLGTHC